MKGNLIAWQQFDDATMDGAYVDMPSQCDGEFKLSLVFQMYI